MTVTEYLRFCAELKKIPREQREDQLQQVLALTHLEDMRSRLIRNLSKGYRQRVAWPRPSWASPRSSFSMSPPWDWTPSRWWRSGI